MVLLYSVSAISLRAQPESQKLLELGGLVGLNISRLNTSSQEITTYSRVGYSVGALLRLNLANLYLQPEVLYSSRGSDLQADGGERVTVDFRYLEVPLMVGFKIINKERYNVRVMGGPVAAYAVSIEGDDNFENAQWNAQLGVGVDVAFLTFDTRYEWGLNDLRTSLAKERGFDKSVTTRNLRISLGLKF